jgi:hypothetical protein
MCLVRVSRPEPAGKELIVIGVVRLVALTAAMLLVAAAALAQSGADSARAGAAPTAAADRHQMPATIQIERRGEENPFIEVMNTTKWGALGGLLVGGAISLAARGNDNGEGLRWGIIVGTFAGLGYGIWHVSSRAQPRALLELDGGRARLNPMALAAVEAGAGVHVRAFAVRF